MSEDRFPSEIFLEAFSSDAGSIRGTCGCCGRTCYQSSCRGYFDEGELEELERAIEKEPDKYADFGDCGVGFGEISGIQFIYDCPCRQEILYKYEDFIWSHRQQIIEYLTRQMTEKKEQADADDKAIESLREKK